MTPPVKRSVALALVDDAGRLLLVRRPPDDAELPDVWGLPAATLAPDESSEDAAQRAARDKLGITIEGLERIAQGSQQRGDTRLDMRLFRARVVAGRPAVPQPNPEVTQYTALQWGDAQALVPGAARGSLCCRLMLESGA